MGTMVHVILSGIVSLVPQGNGSYLIRMQQDTRPVPEHERHFPSILTEERRASTSLPFAMAKPENKPVYKAWKIETGTLTIKNAIESGALKPPVFNDVLKIAGACPEDEERKCAISSRDFNGVELEVRRGKLETIGLEPYRWYFKGQGAYRPVEEVVWTFEILDPPLRLSMNDGPVLFTVYAPHGDDIEIRLQNVPASDLIPTPEESPPNEDEHVDLYFEHSFDPPKCRPVKLLRTQDPAVRDVLPNYRLAGRRIVDALYSGTIAAHAVPGTVERARSPARWKKIDARVVRVNCPPALWNALQP